MVLFESATSDGVVIIDLFTCLLFVWQLSFCTVFGFPVLVEAGVSSPFFMVWGIPFGCLVLGAFVQLDLH